MNKQKQLIILIALIILIIIGIIVLLISTPRQNKSSESIQQNIESQSEETFVDNGLQQVDNVKMYFNVKECITKYFTYISKIHVKDTRQGLDYTKMLYSLLDPQYLSDNSITESNVTEKINIGSYDFIINNMYYQKEDDKGFSYIVNGKIINLSTNEVQDYGLVVEIANSSSNFYIIPYEYIVSKDIYSKLEIGTKNIEFINKKIDDKYYNNFQSKAIDDAAIATELFLTYKKNQLFDIEHAYNTLDKEYKENRFENINSYIDYVERNKDYIQNSYIDKYQTISQDDYTQYVCVDTKGNYWIFNVKNIMDYSAILDTYTIDLADVTEKYNSASNENKVTMNAEKIRNAINSQDYNYVYNKLDETFKQNKYPNIESFEEYIKNTLFKYNQFNYKEASKEGEVYALTFTVEDIEKNTDKQIEGTIIMQLKEGTDFVMSFNFE